MHFGAYTYHDSLKCRCTQGLKHGRCCSTPHLDLTYTSLRPHRNCQLNCLFYFLWRWEVYVRCMVPVLQHLTWLRGLCTKAMRKTTWGLGLFLRVIAEKRVCHKSQVSSAQTSGLPWRSLMFPRWESPSSLPQEAIFLATNDTLALGLQESHSVPGTVCLYRRGWHRVCPSLFFETTGKK